MSLKIKEAYQTFLSRVIDWLSRRFPRFFYRHLYREHLIERHRYFDVTGLITRGDSPLESDRIFVPLHLTPKSIGEISTSLIQDKPDGKRQEIWHYLSLNDSTLQHWALVAGPGFGKSTLMRHMTLTIMARNKEHRPKGISLRLPILLFLREHTNFLRSDFEEVPRPITESIPPALYAQLRQTLLVCGPFASQEELVTLFANRNINPWLNQIPTAQSRESRVEALIYFLHNQYRSDTGENALVLFLQALIDRTNPDTACYDELVNLAHDLSVELMMVQQQQASRNDAAFNRNYTLLDAVKRDLEKYTGPSIPKQWFEKQLQKGLCLILFDGLDEIPNPHTRKQAAAWIEAQIIAYPKNHFVLSSRPNSYQHAQFERFSVLEVMSFNRHQIKEFVNNWYFANELKGITEISAAIRKDIEEKASHFLGSVWKNERLFKLATNPLLLTMMIYVHRYRGVLPRGRAELFDEVIQVLFSRRKGYLPSLSSHQKQTALQPLAYEMMQQRVQNINTKEAIQIVKIPLRKTRVRVPGSAFLQAVESSAGLLREEDNRSYRFAHLTFQEYLTAVYAKEKDLEQEIANHVADEWWHETICLYCAQTDATRIIRACLADGRLSELTFKLALNCLQETPTVSEKTKKRLESVIKRCLIDSKRTHIVANAFAENRKSRMVRLSANKFIDPKLITHAEYQVFLHERQQKNEYHQPDHWLTTSFPNKLAHEPIVGVRPEDAKAFCRWLTQKEGDGYWRFRLPTLSELEGQGLFGLKIEGNANYWVWKRGKHQCLGAFQAAGLNVELAKKQLLRDVRSDPPYDVKALFPNGIQMLNLASVKQTLTAFDFSQSQSQHLIHRTHSYARQMFSEIVTVTQILAPLAQHFDQEEFRFKEACLKISHEINYQNTQIDRLNAELTAIHDRIETNYSGAYRQIKQDLDKQNNELSHQKEQRQDIEAEEQAALDNVEEYYQHSLSQIQEQIADIESTVESEKARIRSHYQSQYRILDQDKQKFKAEIRKTERKRGQYTEDSINQAISQYENILSEIESNRKELNDYEQKQYQDITSQADTALAQLKTRQNELRQQVEKERENIRSRAKRDYDIIEQNIKIVESNIANLKEQERELKKEEQQQKDKVSHQVNEKIDKIRKAIAELSHRKANYRSKEHLFHQNAATIRMSEDHFSEKLRVIRDILEALDAFLANYFACTQQSTAQLKENIAAIDSHLKKLVALTTKHTRPQSSSALSVPNYLQELINQTQKAKEDAAILHQIIQNVTSLDKWITSSHNNFQALKMDNLPAPSSPNNAVPALYKSLEHAYNYLRYRRRETVQEKPNPDIYYQLHFTRVCILGVISHHINHLAANPSTAEVFQYMQIYTGLQILEARLQGKAQAFEGIRLIKERKATIENA